MVGRSRELNTGLLIARPDIYMYTHHFKQREKTAARILVLQHIWKYRERHYLFCFDCITKMSENTMFEFLTHFKSRTSLCKIASDNLTGVEVAKLLLHTIVV